MAHKRHRIFCFAVLYQRPDGFWHVIGLTMLRERPFGIYAGQEDAFGPGNCFHDTIFLFAYNTKRTMAFNLSWIIFSKTKMIPGFFF